MSESLTEAELRLLMTTVEEGRRDRLVLQLLRPHLWESTRRGPSHRD